MGAGLGLSDAKLEYAEATVNVNGSGAGSVAITFAQAFVSTPAILVIPNEADEADGAVYSASGASKTGFTLNVASSNLVSREVRVKWFAHAKD